MMPRLVRRTVLLIASVTACERTPPAPTPPNADEHARTVEAWSRQRIEKLRTPDGWLSLIGLYWLEPGENTFGSDPANRFTYDAPGVPATIGTFTLRADSVRFDAAAGVAVFAKGEPVRSVEMVYRGDSTTTLESGSLEWLIIRRGDRIAVRARDTLSVIRTGFQGIDRYPVSPGWRFAARFIAHEPADTIEVPNILGTVGRTASPGTVEFMHEGEKVSLRMWKDSDDPANFFTAFADRTNGAETYGGGRFLWVDAPDADGWTVVDFNRAYNPPCVFTDYATCPLPPRENRLPFPIPAGEKMYSGAGHG
jgi:uncharacterized protein